MRRSIKRFVGLVAVTVFAACSSDSAGPRSELAGSYALITINGNGLPVLIYFDPTVALRITGGNLVLNSNNTFSASGTYQETFTGQQPTSTTENCTGTYVVNGNSVTFTETFVTNTNCGGVYTGSWDGSNTLSVAYDATFQAVFRK